MLYGLVHPSRFLSIFVRLTEHILITIIMRSTLLWLIFLVPSQPDIFLLENYAFQTFLVSKTYSFIHKEKTFAHTSMSVKNVIFFWTAPYICSPYNCKSPNPSHLIQFKIFLGLRYFISFLFSELCELNTFFLTFFQLTLNLVRILSEPSAICHFTR